jgi:antirestriction protein ArdC
MQRKDTYQLVTDQVVALLEAGVNPWVKTWVGNSATMGARSLSTGKLYRGGNACWLDLLAGGQDSWWGTYKAIQQAGGQVRKGEKGTIVTYWKMIPTKDKVTGEKKLIPFLRHFTVFQSTQADWANGFPTTVCGVPTTVEDWTEEDCKAANTQAEAIAKGYIEGGFGPSFKEEGASAFYRPSKDSVTVPPLSSFNTESDYWTTVFHELGHSTGHADRLARKGITESDGFGGHIYAFEELVAEFTALFLASEAGIHTEVVDNSASYLASWAKQLKDNPKWIVQATGKAAKAAALILARGDKAAALAARKAEYAEAE